MSKIDIVRRCNICGAILQSEDKDAPGYIDGEILANKPLDSLVSCSSCYEENIFHMAPSSSIVSEDFLTILDDARATEALIVYLVDLFSFESYFVKEINERIKSLPILVIGNKRDLLPKSAKDEDLSEYVAHRFRVAGLPIQKENVLLASLSSQKNLDFLMKEIEERRRAHDVYIIGAPLSGKSFFFNAFLAGFRNKTKRPITTRQYKGTNLRLMRIPLDSSSFLYDTPGAGGLNNLLLEAESLDAWRYYPASEVKARVFPYDQGTSFLFGSLARIDFLEVPEKGKLKAYFAPSVDILKSSAKKLDDYFHKGTIYSLKVKPFPNKKISLKELDVFEISIEEEELRDIGLAGFGWISLKGKGTKIRVYLPKGAGLYTSRAKIK